MRDPLLNAETEKSSLTRPLTSRDLEVFSGRQMKAKQGKVKQQARPNRPSPAKARGAECAEGVKVPS